jgi:hypothetical protein
MGLWARCGDGLGCPVGWGRGLDWVAGREQLRPLGSCGLGCGLPGWVGSGLCPVDRNVVLSPAEAPRGTSEGGRYVSVGVGLMGAGQAWGGVTLICSALGSLCCSGGTIVLVLQLVCFWVLWVVCGWTMLVTQEVSAVVSSQCGQDTLDRIEFCLAGLE